MNNRENSWDELWNLFTKISLEPIETHQLSLSEIEDEELKLELSKLLKAHYSQSEILDNKPEWQTNIAQTFEPPIKIKDYVIISKLGSGGIGDVYLASKNDDGFERKVAIKFATTGRFSKHVLTSFNTELEVLLSLNHSNIERLYDGGITKDNIPYLIVEYIDGCHLDKYCDENQLDIEQRLKLFQKICTAVAAVHRSLIVHRDIKTGNIMVGKSGEPKLLDFGLARLTEKETKDKNTTLSSMMMTLAYASPEQINAQNITTSSDIYSLGILLYYLLTGKLPYEINPTNIVQTTKVITEYIPKLASKNIKNDSVINKIEKKLSKRLGGDLEQIIAKSIAKEPEKRYLSALSLCNDIQNYLDNKPVVAKADSVYYRLGKFFQRHKTGVGLSSITISALAFLSINLFLQSQDLERSLVKVKHEQQRVNQVTNFLKDMFKASDPLITDKKIVSVKELLDYSSQQLASQFNSEPQTKATLYATLGNVYLNLSHLSKAEEMFNHAIKLFDNKSAGQINMHIARVRLYQQQDKYKSAQNELDAIITSNDMAKLPLETQAQVQVYQAQNHYKLGNYDLAELDFNSALKKRIRLYGDKHQLVIDIYQYLGHVNWRLGKFEKTKVFYQLAYDLNLKALGENNHKTLKSLSSLGLLANAQGKPKQALPYFKTVAKARLNKLGKFHTLTAYAYNRLGLTYFELANYTQAQEALLFTKEIYEELNLNESSSYAHTLNNLALVLRNQKQYSKAQEMFLRVKTIEEKTIGIDHPATASTYNNLGMSAADLGDFQQSLGFFKQAYDKMYEKQALKNVNITFPMTNMARMYLELDNIEQAQVWLDKALKLRQDKLGADNIYTIETLSASVLLAIEQNRLDFAKQSIELVIKVRQAEFPADDWRIAEAHNINAALNNKQELFKSTLKIIKEKLGENHYRYQQALKRQRSFNL